MEHTPAIAERSSDRQAPSFLEEADDEPPDSSEVLRHPQASSTPPMGKSAKNGLIVRFPVSRTTATNPVSRMFRKRFFPKVSGKLWNDWHWQVAHRIRTAAELTRYIPLLSKDEEQALYQADIRLPLAVTPYYMSLVSPADPDQALRRTVVPVYRELIRTPGEADDPLSEEAQSPVPGLVHRYPDRVLLLALDFCSTYCRYCTRSRVVGHGALHPTRTRLERALTYIESKPEIRDVLLSGGDPFLLGDDRLEWILCRLHRIPHVEIIRIGTKVPAVLPQRITPKLVKMLKRYHPLWMSLHFTHPDECTPESQRACSLLADAGIPLGSQTVLLKGVNDTVDIMKNLVHCLMKMRVRPYYLYQCDPISGSSHFRTPVETGMEIIRGLRGFTSGYAVPTYVVDAPAGGGKIPLMPDYIIGREGRNLVMKNYEGNRYQYPNAFCDPI
ncbi:KamA family radical SAM protein [Desulfococcus multivorans]|uniref:L-lysine 2,3-aminomutase n=1 Tax=Desulfococcus multivorans DSM 2059 TaxID=1121405 RepID=S7TXN6_DESML|nr:KamA family radical SAM protein [Desulfococcus multivorans]AOY56822.1 KamA: L-lysine 2,3-aminomutase [Desulfococcus multivorans]AQU99368.1 lysine 2,3-aminomutase [Desulfococcus multivorans]EPR41836.1 lysine 2,3-aminomutase YodO family protein [Desulfococcus multivorans DSM 2059]SJZ92804.1 L-lysine 2,3-aminomutase [Desulfococcus multivorans DSM 2059]